MVTLKANEATEGKLWMKKDFRMDSLIAVQPFHNGQMPPLSDLYQAFSHVFNDKIQAQSWEIISI